MNGLIEQILNRCYGVPGISEAAPFVKHYWGRSEQSDGSTLYKHMAWERVANPRLLALQGVYGDAVGGSLVWDSVNVAMLSGPKVFGLYIIEELWQRPEVLQANRVDQNIIFFMDASNVWYYGIRNGDLYVYDAPFEELDRLGPVEREIEGLIAEWESAYDKADQ